MKHSTRHLIAALVVVPVAAWSGVASAADAPASQPLVDTQELANTAAAEQVISATWIRQGDNTYMLRVVVKRPEPQGPVDVREALKSIPQAGPTWGPYPIPNWSESKPPVSPRDAEKERSSKFISDIIEKLRNLDPTFSCGARLGSSGELYRVVEAWVMKSDGSLMKPVNYTCETKTLEQEPRGVLVTSYDYAAADGAMAIAATVRVSEDYYTDTLKPMATPAAVQ